MKGMFAVALLSVLLGLAEPKFPLNQGIEDIQTAGDGSQSSDQRRYLLNAVCKEGSVRPKQGKNCVYYERCLNGNYTTLQCPRGTLLDLDTYSCDPAHNVDTRTCTSRHTASSGHVPTTQSSHGRQFSVPCADHRCYYGGCGAYHQCSDSSCSSYKIYHRCGCWNGYGYDGYECQLKEGTATQPQCNRKFCRFNKDQYYKEMFVFSMSMSVCQNKNIQCGHGDCMKNVLNSSYTCMCKTGYTGQECDLQIAQGYHCNDHCKYGTCVYSKMHFYCNCFDGYTGTYCDKNSAAASIPTAPTTSTSTPTSHALTSYLRCKVMTLLDLANQVPVTNPNIQSCPSGSFASPEAFVLNHCGVGTPSSWTRGVNVMKECHTIPLYTPVATFMRTTYTSRGGLSGVFLGCLPNGFKLGAQPCDAPPKIVHVENGVFPMNSHYYYTVQ